MTFVTQLQTAFQRSSIGRWYFAKEATDQRILAALALVLGLAMVWLLLWKPISDWRALSHNRYETAQATLNWMRANEQRARASASVSADSAAKASPVARVTRAAQGLGLKLSRLQPRGDGGVTVALEGQSFDSILAWLAGLQENNGILASKVSISQKDQPGLVDAQVDLN